MYNKNNNNKAIVMASGGIDSTVILYDLYNKGIDTYPVIVNYGQKNYKTELKHLEIVNPFSNKIIEISIPDIYALTESKLLKEIDLWEENMSNSDNYVPYRSHLLILISAILADIYNINQVYFGFIDTENVNSWDCKKQYLKSIFATFNTIDYHIPLIDLNKIEVVKIGFELHAPLAKTFSCQNNIVNHCGVCPNCIDRIISFKEVLISE